MEQTRVAVVVSNPIQHFCPQYSSWSRLKGIELCVFFASDSGKCRYFDADFGRSVEWHSMELDFHHLFLRDSMGAIVDRNLDASDLEENLVKFGPSALVVHGYIQKLQRRAMRWASKAGVPIIMIGDSELRSPRGILTRVAKRLVLPSLLRKVDLFMTVGDSNEAYYRHYGVSDLKFVRSSFPIHREHYDNVLANRLCERRKVRGSFGIPEDHIVLLNVGKFVRWKRQCDLTALSGLFLQSGDPVTVLLVGSGPEGSALRQSVQREGVGGVIFGGFQAPEDLAAFYCAADIYVHCASQEPHSLAISEAIYCGLPSIISNRCGSFGPTDDVRRGLNGLVYTCGNVAELHAQVNAMAGRQGVLGSMSRASSEIGRERQDLAHGTALTQALVSLSLRA